MSKERLKHKLKLLENVEDITITFSNTFLTAKEDGCLEIDHVMAPHLAGAVEQSFADALVQKQVRSQRPFDLKPSDSVISCKITKKCTSGVSKVGGGSVIRI